MDHLPELVSIQDAILSGRDKRLCSLLQSCTPEAVSAPIDEEGTTLLHLAANTENPNVLSLLLDVGVSVNAQNGDGFTPLHVAAMWGQEESIRLLMERGADPVISDDDEMTPLDYAKSEGHILCVKLLAAWSSPLTDKENTFNSANYADHQTELPPICKNTSDPTVDQSMVEAFVSMYLNMTQVAQDLTEVTELSELHESPSLLDILTTQHLTSPPHHLNTTPHEATPPLKPLPLADEPEDEDDCQLTQGRETTARAACVRRLELACKESIAEPSKQQVITSQWYEDIGLGLGDDKVSQEARDRVAARVCNSSLLVLAPHNDDYCSLSPPAYHGGKPAPSSPSCYSRKVVPSSPLTSSESQLVPSSPLTSSESQLAPSSPSTSSDSELVPSSPPTCSDSGPASVSQNELFTTAMEPSHYTSDTHTTLIPSESPSTPFLAESLRKIELRRKALQQSTQQRSHPSANSGHSRTENNPQPHARRKLVERLRLTSAGRSHDRSHDVTPPTISDQRTHVASETAGRSHDRSHDVTPPTISDQRTRVASETVPSHNSSLLADRSFVFKTTHQILPHLHKLTNQELRQRLIDRGEHPGPVTDQTRAAYLLYLSKLKTGIQPAGNTGYKGYKYELALVLNGTCPIPDFSSLEYEIFWQFHTSRLPSSPLRTLPSITASAFPLPRTLASPVSPRSKRDWSTKTHFNYLLLDPSQLAYLREGGESVEEFRWFVESVFYVGKGKDARSLQHLKDARDKMNMQPTKLSAKFSRILSIWSSGQGVVSLHIFHNTTAEEAFCREACMIDAIGLDILTNVQKGHVYGRMANWGAGKRRQFGVYLLHKAYLCYLLDPPQPVGQHDF